MRTLRRVKPKPEQLPILGDYRPGYRVIRGAAGSGKTTVALLRLRQLCASRLRRKRDRRLEEPVRVLALTFNRTLRGYIQQLATEQLAHSPDLDVTVETFGKWALSLVGHRRLVEDKKEKLKPLLRGVGVRSAEMDYFIDEIDYIMGRFRPTNRHEYLDTVRFGRGRSPIVQKAMRARLLTDVVEKYESAKASNGESDWNDIALEASDATSDGYDVVVVDEAQDLSANQLRAVQAHLKQDHATTFVIDAAQRIYPRGFRWRELGIHVNPGMVYTLSVNHRNTKEIARFARSFVRDLPPDEDGVLPDENASERTGELPEVVIGTYSAQLRYMLNRVAQSLGDDETVAILQPWGGGWFDYARRTLEEREIPYCELTQQSDWPTGPELVALSTMHSAKGLEFDHLLLPGLNHEVTPHGDGDGDGSLEQLRRLVAMAVGRAHKTVSVGYKPGVPSTLIDFLEPGTYNLVKV